jgi:hypothetical protein
VHKDRFHHLFKPTTTTMDANMQWIQIQSASTRNRNKKNLIDVQIEIAGAKELLQPDIFRLAALLQAAEDQVAAPPLSVAERHHGLLQGE